MSDELEKRHESIIRCLEHWRALQVKPGSLLRQCRKLSEPLSYELILDLRKDVKK